MGLERAGMNTSAFCEIDPYCQRVLKKHWPNTPIFSDVKSLSKEDLLARKINNINVITLGFPCTDISEANLEGKGLKGERSGLWKEGLRLIEEIRPRWVIIENVSNIRSKGLVEVLQDLSKVGYDCEWNLISATSFCQAPIVKDRIWIVAFPSGLRRKGSNLEIMDASGTTIRNSNQAMSANGNRRLQTVERGQKEIPEEIANISTILWENFSSEEEQYDYWSRVYQKLLSPWEDGCFFPRISPKLPRGLDKFRREQIKQLGNSVIPIIPQLIGNCLIKFDQNLSA